MQVSISSQKTLREAAGDDDLFSTQAGSTGKRTSFCMFATNPPKLLLCLEVSQFVNGSPAALTSISSCSFLLYHLGS